MHTDMAANSDSTLTYSQPVRSPARTSFDTPSTMWVCGEMGYAATTSGRQRATVSATAREPSSCLSMGGLGVSMGGLRGGHVALRGGAGEAVADRGVERADRHGAGLAGQRSEQRRA